MDNSIERLQWYICHRLRRGMWKHLPCSVTESLQKWNKFVFQSQNTDQIKKEKITSGSGWVNKKSTHTHTLTQMTWIKDMVAMWTMQIVGFYLLSLHICWAQSIIWWTIVIPVRFFCSIVCLIPTAFCCVTLSSVAMCLHTHTLELARSQTETPRDKKSCTLIELMENRNHSILFTSSHLSLSLSLSRTHWSIL